jgi:hypothetical protein
MGYDNQRLDAEDKEMDEVTQALIQEDVEGKRRRYMKAQSEDRIAVGSSRSHKRPRREFLQERADKSVPFHAVSQVIASSNQVCLVIIQQQSSQPPHTPDNFNGHYSGDPPGWVHELPKAFSEAIKATLPEVMAAMTTGIKEVCRCIGVIYNKN